MSLITLSLAQPVNENESDATQLLNAVEQDNPKAAEELLDLVYEELRRLAAWSPLRIPRLRIARISFYAPHSDLARYASTLRLDARRLMSEVLPGTYTSRVREDFRSGARHGINWTPSFFMNGVLYNGTTSVEEMLSALTGEAG